MLRIHGSIRIADDVAIVITGDDLGDLFLRLAYVEFLEGHHLIPDSILDDWGREKRGTELYSWIHENGSKFPRAEVFGFRPNGLPVQRFLREIDLSVRYPCYAYTKSKAKIEDGTLIKAVVVPDSNRKRPNPLNAPSSFPKLLAAADVQWWSANPDESDQIDAIFSKIIGADQPSPPGN